MGTLKACTFDRNEFGAFLGSATVVYENKDGASKAIEEYNGAYLDEKLLTVEYDSASSPGGKRI
jgi:RNA recognition motif-containing protein